MDQRSGSDLRAGATATSGAAFGIICRPPGYDARMSESSNEPGRRSSDGSDDTQGDDRLIADEQLPEDLQPEKNPLASDPEDEPEEPGG